MAEYFITVRNPYNVKIATIRNFYKLELFRTEMSYGSLYLDIPFKDGINIDFQIDGRIDVWRKTHDTGVVRLCETQWLIRNVRHKVDENGVQLVHILAYDPLVIIDKYIVAYVAGTPYSLKEDMPADDMIKQIARENFGNLATDWKRDLSEWLCIEEDKSQAPVISMDDMAFEKIMPNFEQICEKSAAAGMYLSYDIVYDDTLGKLILKTYTKQRGISHGSDSALPLVFGIYNDPINALGNGLNYASIETDATDEHTFVYSGQASQDTNCFYASISNDDIIKSSPFGRREDYITAGDASTPDTVLNEARAWLQHKTRKTIINGHIEQLSGLRYGIDYGYGDLVVFRYLGKSYDIHLDEIRFIVDERGKEDITVFSTKTEYEHAISPLPSSASIFIVNEPSLDEDENVKDRIAVPLYYKNHSIAQSIKTSASKSIEYVDVMMRRVGLPDRSVTLSICANSSGKPGSEVSSATVTYDYFPDGAYNWVRFKFSTSVSITGGTTYWIKLTCGAVKSKYTNYYRAAVEDGLGYLFGVFRISANGTTWTTNSGTSPQDEETTEDVDLVFAVGGVNL